MTASDPDRIETLLRQMDEPDIQRERFNDLDSEFHVAIAESSGNRLIADLTVAVRESIRPDIQNALKVEENWPMVRDGLRQDHHSIYDALLAGDGTRAADLLQQHILGFYERMKRTGGDPEPS